MNENEPGQQGLPPPQPAIDESAPTPSLASAGTTAALPAWSGPIPVTVATIVFFAYVRFVLGGAPYLCSRAWYAFCLLVPFPFLFLGIGLGGICVPLDFDIPTAVHLGLVLLYCQIDLLVSRFLVLRDFASRPSGATADGQESTNAELLRPSREHVSAQFGSINVVKIMLENLHPLRSRTPLDLGSPALLRGCFEFNGALLHEVFWNVFICQNFLNHKYPPYLAIALVPVLSCVVHGIVCNWVSGYRCFPQFLWVVLAYHASGGSVLIPGLIHACWYFMDGRLLCVINIFKAEWDLENRKEETFTPHADKYWWLSIVLISGFYAMVSFVAIPFGEKYFRMPLTSPEEHADPETACRYNELNMWPFGKNSKLYSFDTFLVYASGVQILFGAATWRMVRTGMDVIEKSGELTKQSKEYWAALMVQELEFNHPRLAKFLNLQVTSTGADEATLLHAIP
ncbi:unnamed protein product [Amoebophrya sp. A120]|nr:unnamed protein product [Amoebophrya sp. A120]|eukprot:GSA120T00024928001.1